MTTGVFFLVLLAGLGVMLYHRISLKVVSAAIFGALLLYSVVFHIPYLLWILALVILVPLNLPGVRKNYLARPIFDVFKKIMPTISDTEKEALEAGSVWWAAEVFGGKPDWKRLHGFAKPSLSAEEQAFLDGPVEEVCKMVNDWNITFRDSDLSPEVWQFLKDNGFFAMIIPKRYGGLEFSAYGHSQVLIKLNSVSGTLGTIVSVPNSLGPAELLMHYGTTEQKDYYLPRLAKGQDIPCFALTAPEAGSDAGAIPDRGVVCKGEFNGEEVLGMKLTWDKRYITLAPVASVLGLAFKMYDPDGLLGDEPELGITCALIPVETEGVEIGRRHLPLSVPFQNGPTSGKDVFVPLDYIIGGKEGAGQGWRMLVDCLSAGRAISLPSGSIAGAKMSAFTTGAYARIRKQFKVPVGSMEGVMEALARIAGKTYAMTAAGSFTAAGIDEGEKPSVASAIVKYNVTHQGREVINDAMDVHGGKAIMLGPKNYMARAYQGAPIGITVEGANILTRSLIIYGQGSIRCHPYVLKEMMATQSSDDKAGLKLFDEAFFGHIGFTMSNKVRAFWLGLTNSLFVISPRKDFTKRYYQHITRFSAMLAFLSDVAMGVLGGELKRRESLSGRLGDMLSQLYISTAILKTFDDKGRPASDEAVVRYALEDSLLQMQNAALGILKNFPNRFLGIALKILVFPLGRPVAAPSDKLGRIVARQLQEDGAMRDELTAGIFSTVTETTNVGKVDKAFKLQLLIEPLIKKLGKALERRPQNHQVVEMATTGLAAGIITQDEFNLIEEAEAARMEIIHVDDFDPEELKRGPATAAQKSSIKAIKPKQRKPRSKKPRVEKATKAASKKSKSAKQDSDSTESTEPETVTEEN